MSIAITFKENLINDGFEGDNITGLESVTNIEGNVYIKYALHCAGYAKDYKVEGTMNLIIAWEQGQTLTTDNIETLLTIQE